MEVVVSLAVFFIIIGIAVDIFISVVQGQRRVLEEQELLNQTSYAIEYMSTAIKMSQHQASQSGSTSLAIRFLGQTELP